LVAIEKEVKTRIYHKGLNLLSLQISKNTKIKYVKQNLDIYRFRTMLPVRKDANKMSLRRNQNRTQEAT
jgi:hypothetical protein